GVHPDHHAWWIHPENGNFMIDGNDGGMNITKDGGKTWRFIGNLPVAQFYHINVDNEIPYNVYGGMQDNGSWRGPAYVWRSQGIRNSYWQEISFGDGFDVVPDPDDNQFGWSMSQQGFVSRYDWKTGNNYSVRPTHPDPEMKLRFNWNAAINIDPFNSNILYFGSQFVHKSTDKGLTWELISGDLTTNDPQKQKQSESGGLTMDATGAENHTTILVIEPSKLEQNMLWVGTDDGKVHYTQNGGASWSDVSKNIKGLPEGSWIVQIKASNKAKGEALMVANDYRRFNYTPYAYRTRDYGKTWERIVDGNDVLSYALSIAEDPVERNLLFLGTDDGLYVSIDAGRNWQKWTKGFPTTSVKDLVIQEREHDLVIGTFGRAAWVLDDIRPLRAIAKNQSLLNNDLKLFDPPIAYQAAYQQPTGSRFGGDALYSGENRDYGARLKFYFRSKEKAADKNEEEEEGNEENDEFEDSSSKGKKDELSKDSLYLKIYDGSRLIRTLKRKIPDSTGIYNWTWFMREAGSDRPSRTLRKRRNEPGGVQVKPGTYRAEIMYMDLKSTTNVKVESDPRLSLPIEAINEAYTSGKQLQQMTQTASDAVKQLIESKNTASDFQKKFKKEDKEKFKEEIKASKEIVKKIDSIVAIYIGKEDKRQGITRNPEVNVVQRLGLARRYSSSRPNGLTETEKRLIAQATEALRDAVQTTNGFFNSEWSDYKSRIEQVELSPFKETQEFSID
ncbi:MAG: hypothetical protein KJO23_04640, partial [Bacteroidia bacterium]|nr:hypothetical protein [Bacteroidia bacterium]